MRSRPEWQSQLFEELTRRAGTGLRRLIGKRGEEAGAQQGTGFEFARGDELWNREDAGRLCRIGRGDHSMTTWQHSVHGGSPLDYLPSPWRSRTSLAGRIAVSWPPIL